ncbi:MAG: SDR family NAD(P)-dependent oxidoreductase [Cyanobacteria bacterium P01_F01_bin.42]
MTKQSQQKRALVTGGNRGIGYAICAGLLESGFEVLLGSRNMTKATQAADKLKTISPTVRGVDINVTDDNNIQNTARTLELELGYLNVLINNAGIYPDNGIDILTINRMLLTQTMETNTFGPIQITQAFLPLLKSASDARVINVSSGYGALAGLSPDVPSYCLSKLALNGATMMLADALRPHNIAVNAICPGWVKTEMGGESAPRTPEQGADTAIWLATQADLSVTGKFFRDREEISY